MTQEATDTKRAAPKAKGKSLAYAHIVLRQPAETPDEKDRSTRTKLMVAPTGIGAVDHIWYEPELGHYFAAKGNVILSYPREAVLSGRPVL